MKRVTYFCDLCDKEIKYPKEEDSCTQLLIQTVHDWEKDIPIAKVHYDKRICRTCRDKIINAVEKIIDEEKLS